MRISNCGHDENGKYHGGKAGDNTGNEWEIIKWNSFYKMVLRHPNTALARMIELQAICAANNDHIGYDQDNRGTFWKELEKVNYLVPYVKNDCECDCSSGVSAIIKSVGFLTSNTKFSSISSACTTSNLEKVLTGIGFIKHMERELLTSDKQLLPGDILLNPGHHVAIAVSEMGSSTKAEYEVVPAKYKDTRYNHTYVCREAIALKSDNYNTIRMLPIGAKVKCYGFFNVWNDLIMLLVTYGSGTGYVPYYSLNIAK